MNVLKILAQQNKTTQQMQQQPAQNNWINQNYYVVINQFPPHQGTDSGQQ